MADNWYIALDLPFDPPEMNESVISQKIDEKAKFWSKNSNDFKMGDTYKRYQQSLSIIKEDMLGSPEKRKAIAEEAKQLVYGEIDKKLNLLLPKGSVTHSEIENISKRTKHSVELIKKRALTIGLKMEDSQKIDYQSIYDRYCKVATKSNPKFVDVHEKLKNFNNQNLYHFLGQEESNTRFQTLPAAELKRRADEKKKNEFYKHDNISGTGSKICAEAAIIFSNEEKKKEYDHFLELLNRKKILSDIKEASDISGGLSNEQAEIFLQRLTEDLKDRLLAEKVLVAYCHVEKINYQPVTVTTKKIKVCRCGCTNDVTDGRKNCQRCGLPLEIKCPRCGTVNESSVNICRCGFDLRNIDRSEALCDEAESALRTLNLTYANKLIQEATAYWQSNPRLKSIKTQLTRLEKEIGSEINVLQQAITAKAYYRASQHYERLLQKFPNYSNKALSQEIEEAIQNAKQFFQKAKASKNPQEIIDLCQKCIAICKDFPGINTLIPAPPAVASVNIKTDGNRHHNIISWQAVEDRSVNYRLVRSSKKWALSPEEEETIYEGSDHSFVDMTIEPGMNYYYSVFSERAGVYSKVTTAEVCVNLFEVENLDIIPGDASVKIVWKILPKNATLEIFEVVPNGNKKKIISISQSTSYLIDHLINNKTYTYFVRLSYLVNGKKKDTTGIIKSVIPTCPPEPIDEVRVKSLQKNRFEVIWYQPSKSQVRIYGSTKRPTLNCGDVVTVSVLEQQLDAIQTSVLSSQSMRQLGEFEQGASFIYEGNEIFYVTVVVINGNMAVMGEIAKLANLTAATITDVQPINGKTHIFIEPPKKADGFVVLYRNDRYPLDIEDRQAGRKLITMKQYQLDGNLILDGLAEDCYYLSVFTMQKLDGKSEYSTSSNYCYDASPRVVITYAMSVNKRLFGKPQLILEFSSNQHQFELPEIVLRTMSGHTPMFENSGIVLETIPAQSIRGTKKIVIELSKGLARDTFVKAFLKNEVEKKKNQLQLDGNSSYQIS